MKKIFFLLVLFIASPLYGSISPFFDKDEFYRHFYLQANAGYAFGFPLQHIGQSTEDGLTAVYDGYARGFCMEAGVGYMYTENVAVEVGLSYLAGSPGERSHSDDPVTYTANIPALLPSVLLNLRIGRSVNLYTKFGVCLALPTLKVQEDRKDGGAVYYAGGIATGMRGVVGVGTTGYSTTLFIEAALTDLAWGPQRLTDNMDNTIISYREQFTYPSQKADMQPRFDLSTISVRAGVKMPL